MGVFINLKDQNDRNMLINTDSIVMIESAVQDPELKLSFVYTQNGPGERTVKHSPDDIEKMIDDKMKKVMKSD